MRRASMITLVLVMALSGLNACASGGDSGSKRAMTKAADANAIRTLEGLFHQSTTAKDIETMMSLFSDNAVLTFGGRTFTGKEQIRKFWLEQAAPFKAENHWVSETPAYKIRTTVVGKRATLYFECHYVDVDTGKVVLVNGISQDLQKISGKWLITKTVGSSPILEP